MVTTSTMEVEQKGEVEESVCTRAGDWTWKDGRLCRCRFGSRYRDRSLRLFGLHPIVPSCLV